LYQVGELVYVKEFKGVYPIDGIFQGYLKKVTVLRIGESTHHTTNVRKATANEIKKYKLENIFKSN
jgi:hypothetical protein